MKISEKNKLEYEGKIFSSNKCGDFKILEYRSTSDVLIEFLNTGTQMSVWLGNIKKGTVKDHFYPSVYGIGYTGEGEFKTKIDGVQPTYYKRWKEMISRCYNEKDKEYYCYGAVGVRVCDEWLNFQNYARWWKENCTDESFALDKDILESGNKLYSPEKCCFVPIPLNTAVSYKKSKGSLPTGVCKKGNVFIAQINKSGTKIHLGSFNTLEEASEAYKEAKKDFVKELAEFYKDVLSEKVYKALQNYTITE